MTGQWDKLDQDVVHALEIDGRASFSQIGTTLGVSDKTIARRYHRLTADGAVRVVGVRDVERLGQTWILRLRCAPDAAIPLSKALARLPRTAWIALTSGGTEVIGSIWFRTPGEHEELILGKLPRTPSIMEIRAHQVLFRFYGGPTSWLSKRRRSDQGALLGAYRLPSAKFEAVRPEDEPLAIALEKDGRATLSELGRATGQSQAALRQRLERLLSTGALYIDVQYDPTIFGDTTRSLLWITASPNALDDVGRELATHPEVMFAAATAGPSNLFATIACTDTSAMYDYVSSRLGALPGVHHVETAPVLRQVKELAVNER